MLKLLISFILLTLCAFAKAQSELVRVVCKNGTTLTGAMVKMDGVSSITINIAGAETTIPMSEVQSIEEYSAATTQQNATETKVTIGAADGLSDQYGEYKITDNNPAYPEHFTLQLGSQQLTMVLIRGGVFNMGYDDRHSRRMDSEPVHGVELSSYYVSDDFVDAQTAYDILGGKNKKNKGQSASKYLCNWEDAKSLSEAVAAKYDAPYRLVTEAEWEYAAIQPAQTLVFGKTNGYEQKDINYVVYAVEWCYDFYDEYQSLIQQNPTGPTLREDSPHVARMYSSSLIACKWNRIPIKRKYEKCFVRLAISADKIPNINSDSE